jgi:putative hydroxymethylpyrimidine transport system permease protein
LKSYLLPLVLTLFFLLFWEAFCRIEKVPPFLLPTPSRIIGLMIAEAPLLLRHATITFLEIILGIMLSLAVALPLAVAMFYSPTLERALSPLLVASQAIPVFAVAPLLVVWFGYGMGSKIVMAAVIIFFPVTVTLLQGFKSCNPGLRTLFFVMGADFRRTLRLLYWPWALPYFFSGLRVAVSVAAIGAVIGEWVGSMEGLGFLMMQANARLRVDMVFASIVILSCIGLSLWTAVSCIEVFCIRWNKKEE